MLKEEKTEWCGWGRVNEGQQMDRWAGWLLKYLINHHNEFKFLFKDIAYPLQGLRQKCVTSD